MYVKVKKTRPTPQPENAHRPSPWRGHFMWQGRWVESASALLYGAAYMNLSSRRRSPGSPPTGSTCTHSYSYSYGPPTESEGRLSTAQPPLTKPLTEREST